MLFLAIHTTSYSDAYESHVHHNHIIRCWLVLVGCTGFPRSDSDYDLAQSSTLQLRSDYLLSISKGLGYLILWIFTFDLLVTSHKILRPYGEPCTVTSLANPGDGDSQWGN